MRDLAISWAILVLLSVLGLLCHYRGYQSGYRDGQSESRRTVADRLRRDLNTASPYWRN